MLRNRGSGDLDPDRREERLRDRARGDGDGGVARARALERVADVGEAVLLRPGEVGVPRPRQRHRLRPLAGRLAFGRPRAHPPLPVRVVAIPDDERQWRSERPPVPEPREHLDRVRLDLLAWAATVALLAPAEVAVDRLAVEHEPGREPTQDRDERRAVRLAGRDEREAHERNGWPFAPSRQDPGAARARHSARLRAGSDVNVPRIEPMP